MIFDLSLGSCPLTFSWIFRLNDVENILSQFADLQGTPDLLIKFSKRKYSNFVYFYFMYFK